MLTDQALTRCVRCAAPLVSEGGPWREIRGDRREQLREIVQLLLQEDVSSGSDWRLPNLEGTAAAPSTARRELEASESTWRDDTSEDATSLCKPFTPDGSQRALAKVSSSPGVAN
jgi:hypothetical protein